MTWRTHELDPKVLRLVAELGGTCKRVFLVPYERLTFGGEEGVMGLASRSLAVLGAAVKTVEDLVAEMADAESREVPTSVAQTIT
jgi:hypothetical protein